MAQSRPQDERDLPAGLVEPQLQPRPVARPSTTGKSRLSPPQVTSPKRNRRHSFRRAKENVEEPVSRVERRSSKRKSPDGASLARAGRHFTVGNIGNNGLIYLRPVARPSMTERPRPSPSTYLSSPVTPPDTAGATPSSVGRESFFSSTLTPPKAVGKQQPDRSSHEIRRSETRSPPRPTNHVRAHSFSTVEEASQRPSIDHPGTFKVVIHRPSVKRPKTSQGGNMPHIDVIIPHYRLGTPHFATTGSAILRSSVYTRSSAAREDVLASGPSQPALLLHSSYVSGRQSDARQTPGPHKQLTADSPSQQRYSCPIEPSARELCVAIDPRIYDPFTTRPDDPTVVRYAPGTKDITAATPARLIAHITSPNFLDYELLSDFFLTFRAFIEPHELATYLLARLRWAVDRADDFGRISRVRTFVALRHWILNYFVDDFLPEYTLRDHFCNLVNELYNYLKVRDNGTGGDLSIVGELKKCWRRTCSLYWDDMEVSGPDAKHENIVPGGQDGSRSSFGSANVQAESYFHGQAPLPPAKDVRMGGVPSAKTASISRLEPLRKAQHTAQPSLTSAPWSFPQSSQHEHPAPLSPVSEHSLHVLSCSIPMKPIYRIDTGTDIPLFPHPVQSSTIGVTRSSASATAPFPARHQRSGSFSDTLRDERRQLTSIPDTSQEMLPAVLVIPGCLVRGALYQPTAPYFEVRSQPTIKPSRSRLDMAAESCGAVPDRQLPTSNPGVKKILGSVRRALSNKQMVDHSPTSSTSEKSFPSQSGKEFQAPHSGPESQGGASTQKRSIGRTRNQLRIDILAARTLESFKDAVAKLDREFGVDQEEVEDRAATPTPRFSQPKFNRSVTVGSRSIVIVDDTHPDMPLMSGALQPASPGIASLLVHSQADVGKESRESSMGKMPRATNASIDSVIASQYQPTRSLVQPRVYVPSGLKYGNGEREETIALTPDVNRHRFTNSMRSEQSRASTLRRYASYHSGVTSAPTETKLTEDQDPDQFEQATKSSDIDPFVLDKPPVRQLRRRPGGNLKAVTKVHDLESRRPQSAGSISNASRSLVNSTAVPSTTTSRFQSSAPKAKEAEDDILWPKQKSISLMRTHSSQPNLRPSFEAEVAKLAALPDDDDDDGGIESALLKLEGRYEKRSPSMSLENAEFETEVQAHDWEPGEDEQDRRQRHHHEHVEDIHPLQPVPVSPSSPTDVQKHTPNKSSQSSQVDTIRTHTQKPSQSVLSEDSYSSIPLLERGLSDASTRERKLPRAVARKSQKEKLELRAEPDQVQSANSSIEHVEETESMRRIPRGETMPRSPNVHESFLLDDNQDLSDESDGESSHTQPSENESQGVRSFFDDEAMEDESDTEVFTHPLRHPDTPPVQAQSGMTSSPFQDAATTFIQGLPTPGLTPTARTPNAPTSSTPQPNGQASLRDTKRSTTNTTEPTAPGAHLPFILAYDAQNIAQQFTLIEKDALDEIDWRELVELRWKQTSPVVRDWVEYLLTQDARGVDLVIARFNLVVKWVKSEIVLCDNLDERVRCTVQFIRIAEHCRRLHNYATMYQITIALLSSDCARLKVTWDSIPERELLILAELEKLVQPLKNFHNLRVEMESGTGDDGCIPFIGIYTRDLVYNAQKPAFITTPPYYPDDPLVNFERHHTAATIVKSLLRLLESSSRYQYQLDPVVASRCVWLGALSDEEITARSKKLE